MRSHAPGIVTPEAVVVNLTRAGPGSRILAKGLDTVIQVAALVAFGLADAALSGGSLGTAGQVLYLFAVPLIVLGYPAAMEAGWRGRTLGKAAFGLRVVTREGGPIRFRQALIRSLLFIVDGLLIGPVIGVVLLVVTPGTLRLGDMAAATVVVRERSGASMPTPTQFWPPPGYEELASLLDVSLLGAADYEVVREMLVRAPQLPSQARWRLAVEIAGPISTRLGWRSPPAVHPEVFLTCVAAAYQRRGTHAAAPPPANPAAAPGRAGSPPEPPPPPDPGSFQPPK